MNNKMSETESIHHQIVLGLGNTLRGDDGIGIYAVRELQKNLANTADFVCSEEMGLVLLDHLSGYQGAVIIDSIFDSGMQEGSIYPRELSDFPPRGARSTHYAGLPEVAALANVLGIPFPETVLVLGIAIHPPREIAAGLSPELEQRLPHIVARLESHIANFWRSRCSGRTNADVRLQNNFNHLRS